MKQTEQFLIYGATGYTGKLTARTARDRGLKPILAGRNETKLKAVAEPLGFRHLAFDLSDRVKLDAALREVDAVHLASTNQDRRGNDDGQSEPARRCLAGLGRRLGSA